jgi:hypothetical protein
VGQIRRSSGRLGGLKLALIDGLLFPLLALNATIGGLWDVAAKLIAVFVLKLGGSLFVNLPHALLWLLFAVLTMAWADAIVVRRVWRAVNPTLGGGPPPPAQTKPRLWTAALLVLCLGAPAAFHPSLTADRSGPTHELVRPAPISAAQVAAHQPTLRLAPLAAPPPLAPSP